MGDFQCTNEHIDMFASFFLADEHGVASTKRKGISGTLHRISLITHPLRFPEKSWAWPCASDGACRDCWRPWRGRIFSWKWRTNNSRY
jgi:hypothetical protein